MTKTSIAEHMGARSKGRTNAQLPLFIYGSLPGGDPFYEETFTISVNETGGLMWMASRVDSGQRIIVTNQANDQTQECAVVSVVAQPAGSYVAFRFSTATPQFWCGMEIGKGTLRSWVEFFVEALILQLRGDRSSEGTNRDKFQHRGSQEKPQLHRRDLLLLPSPRDRA